MCVAVYFCKNIRCHTIVQYEKNEILIVFVSKNTLLSVLKFFIVCWMKKNANNCNCFKINQ